MVVVPAFVWRGGFAARALTTGLPVGLLLGALAWLDSGMLLAGVAVLVIMGVTVGIWMARRMVRYWPGAQSLSGDDRASVVDTVRRGGRIADERLAPAVLDYGRGLHAAAETARPFRWLIWFVLAVAVATAAWDAVFGAPRNGVASAIYLVMLLLEMFWWPKHRERLLDNSDRAAALAEQR